MNKTQACLLAFCGLTGCTTIGGRSANESDATKVSYTRIHCTPDNESHFDRVTTDLAKVDAAPPAQPFYARGSAASRVAFAAFEDGWGANDEKAGKYHPAPAAQFVIYLSGEMTVMTSDGEKRRFRTGDVLRVEDVAPCKGHISVAGPGTVHTIVVR